MYDPFDLRDAVIRDLPHVKVTRLASREGRPCKYQKVFKAEGLGDAAYWVQRENEFLLDFALKNLRHVVQLGAVVRDSDGLGTPVVESVVTLDAGVTIEDWLRVQPRYPNGKTLDHPFQHAGTFLRLLRAGLVALREIHALGIVHCDIKEDNLCLPYAPYPFRFGQSIGIDYERVRLIDFAFSITPERPLDRPLPILPMAPYQSNLLKTALHGDRSGKTRGRLAVQKLDYRADLYSLGYLAGRILEMGLLQPAGAGGAAALAGAHGLVAQLRAADAGRLRGGRALPHDAWIADIDTLLRDLKDLDAYRRFEVAQVREIRSAGASTAGEDGLAPTPLTPLAAPDATPLATPVRQKPSGRPGFPVGLVAVLLVAIGGVGYWKLAPTPAPPPGTETKAGEAAGPEKAATAKTGIEAEASRKAREAAKRQESAAARSKAERARAEEDELRRGMEAEAKARAEAEAKRKASEQAKWREDAEMGLKADLARAEEEARWKTEAEAAARAREELRRKLDAEASVQAELKEAAEAEARQRAEAESAQKVNARPEPPEAAVARIDYPGQGDGVGRIVDVRGRLEGLADGQHAFLVIRSKAVEYGRLYYPQGELPRAPGWEMKGVFGTPNYEYETFVVVTGNPESAELLRAPKSRNFGLKSLPEDTRIVSRVVTVRRVQ
jgi:hypothetical protein